MAILGDNRSESAMAFGRAAKAMLGQFAARQKRPRLGASRPLSVRRLPAAFCLLLSAYGPPLAAFCLPHPALASEQSASQNPPAPPSRTDPKAQELLDQAVQALGGPAFVAAKSLTARGRVFAIADGATAGFAPFESTVEYPERRRFSYGKDQPVILVNDGERGWQLDRYGMIRQPPEQIRRWRLANRYSLENLLRRVIHEPGVLIQDGGADFVDDLAVRVVDLMDARRIRLKLYLHKVTFLPVRISYRIQNPETREWEEYAEVYGDYQNVQGIKTPMHITRFLNGERFSEVFRRAAEYNADYPSNYFTPVR
jgi:hypothetical protein